MKRNVLYVISAVFLIAAGMMFCADVTSAKQIDYKKEFSDSVIIEDIKNLNIDRNKDGKLSDREIAAVTDFTVGSKGIYEPSSNVIVSLKDLKIFKNLRSIKIQVRVDRLDPLYGMKKLRTLRIGEKITYKKSINPSRFPDLRELSISQNSIPELDMTGNAKLKVLKCSGCKVQKLNVAKNKKLEELDCGNNNLEKLNVAENKMLKKLHCEKNNLKKLDLSRNSKLSVVACWGNKLTVLSFNEKAEIKDLNCSFNHIASLQGLNMRALADFQFESNNLSELDLRSATKLKTVHAEGNVLKMINLAGLSGLKRFTMNDNNGVKCTVILPQGFTNYSIRGEYEIAK